jgi:hypothetical protein
LQSGAQSTELPHLKTELPHLLHLLSRYIGDTDMIDHITDLALGSAPTMEASLGFAPMM